ncbi:TPA: hypothetical protein ACKPYU_000924 [Stenotrophomonas maltophilia]
MNTPNAPQKRGRKPKTAAEKPTQLTIRMPPKLKLGLELLARAQHRSLSQAVEWALQVGLNSFETDREGTTLGRVLDEAWSKESDPERILAIYRRAPMLLSFEDSAACELLVRSRDLETMWAELQAEHASSEGMREREEALESNYWRTVLAHWEELQLYAVEEANAGRSLQDHSIALRLGYFDNQAGRRKKLLEIYAEEALRLDSEEG